MRIDTKELILQAALRLAMKRELRKATRKEVAAEGGVTDQLVNYHFGSVSKMWDAVVSHACVTPGRYLEIIGQAVTNGDERAMALSDEVKMKALRALART